jgi:hypothetical protein
MTISYVITCDIGIISMHEYIHIQSGQCQYRVCNANGL